MSLSCLYPSPNPRPEGCSWSLVWRSKSCGEVSSLSVCVYVFSSSPKSHLQCLTVTSTGHKDRSEFIWALPAKPMLASRSCWKALVYNSRPDHKSLLKDLRLDNITAESSRGGLFCASPAMRSLLGEKLHPAQSPPSGPHCLQVQTVGSNVQTGVTGCSFRWEWRGFHDHLPWEDKKARRLRHLERFLHKRLN